MYKKENSMLELGVATFEQRIINGHKTIFYKITPEAFYEKDRIIGLIEKNAEAEKPDIKKRSIMEYT